MGPPSLFFSKVLISNGFKFFRKNTFKSVDSAWFTGALSLDKSNTEQLTADSRQRSVKRKATKGDAGLFDEAGVGDAMLFQNGKNTHTLREARSARWKQCPRVFSYPSASLRTSE